MPEGILRTLLVLALGAGAIVFALQQVVDYLLFYPTAGADYTPDEFGIRADSFHIATEDSVRVHAYFLPAHGADRAVLFLHGNAGNASHRLPNAELFARMGVAVLLLDYRGYGLSDGAPSASGLHADARAALDHLMEERGFPLERIVLFGRSLGGAVAIELARGRPFAGVIVESTFTSLRDMVARYIGPFAELMSLRRFDSLRHIQELRSPLLAFHGDADEIVPYELGVRLFEAAPDPKAFEPLDGAGHNDTVATGGTPYLMRIQRFIDAVAPRFPH